MLSRAWIGIALLFVFCAVTVAEESLRPLYSGSARLFSLTSVTVVYPAAEGDAGEVNRLSARRRAEFLREAHGIEAAIAADDALTPEQRSGNLLLLGWNNRLLGTDEAPRPWVRGPCGNRFLDRIDVCEDEALMFASISPYNRERQMVFLSRIDLEQDRFAVIPFVGSDWAVIHGHGPIEQGQFASEKNWPPALDSMAEKRWGRLEKSIPAKLESEHYVLHSSLPELDLQQAQSILDARERALAAAVEALGPPPAGWKIQLFVYDDAEQKKLWSGVADEVHSVTALGQLHMLQRYALSPNPHEEIHLLARQQMGPCYLTALYEGLAIDLAREPDDLELDVFGSLLIEKDRVPEIADLLQEERLRKLSKAGIGYSAAGLLVSWIRTTSGVETLQELYGSRELSAEQLSRTMDRSAKKNQKLFERWIEQRGKAVRPEYAFRKAISEAQQRQADSDTTGAVQALERAIELKPDHALTLYQLGLSCINVADYACARERLETLVGLTLAESESHLIAFGYFQLGRLAELEGSRAEALERFRQVLALPDRHGSHRMALEEIDPPTSPTDSE